MDGSGEPNPGPGGLSGDYYYAHRPRETSDLRAPLPAEGGVRLDTAAAPAVGQAPAGQAPAGALAHNIASKKEQSYYYAHGARQTGEAPAPMPTPVILERKCVREQPTVTTVASYSFADEDFVVKVYVPLENVGAKVSKDQVRCAFKSKSFELEIAGYAENTIHRLAVGALYGEIEPERCKAILKPNKVIVSLRKKGNMHWSSLR